MNFTLHEDQPRNLKNQKIEENQKIEKNVKSAKKRRDRATRSKHRSLKRQQSEVEVEVVQTHNIRRQKIVKDAKLKKSKSLKRNIVPQKQCDLDTSDNTKPPMIRYGNLVII